MKYKHILWDWNGTLLDDMWLCVESLNRILKKRERPPLDEKTYRETFSFPVKKYYETLGFDFKKESFRDLSSEFIKYYRDNFYKLKLHANAECILKKINNNKIQQSILSASKQDILEENIKFFNLEKYFNNIVGVKNHYANGKVDVAFQLVEAIKTKSSDILLIGDTVHDSEVAKEIESDCILIDHGYVDRGKLEHTKRKVFSNIIEVIDHINSKRSFI